MFVVNTFESTTRLNRIDLILSTVRAGTSTVLLMGIFWREWHNRRWVCFAHWSRFKGVKQLNRLPFKPSPWRPLSRSRWKKYKMLDFLFTKIQNEVRPETESFIYWGKHFSEIFRARNLSAEFTKTVDQIKKEKWMSFSRLDCFTSSKRSLPLVSSLILKLWN